MLVCMLESRKFALHASPRPRSSDHGDCRAPSIPIERGHVLKLVSPTGWGEVWLGKTGLGGVWLELQWSHVKQLYKAASFLRL